MAASVKQAKGNAAWRMMKGLATMYCGFIFMRDQIGFVAAVNRIL